MTGKPLSKVKDQSEALRILWGLQDGSYERLGRDRAEEAPGAAVRDKDLEQAREQNAAEG
jgi:hypothetical protein